MKLLAIETSGDACSAALLIDGAVTQVFEIAPRRHGERILPMMQTLLDQAALRLIDLDAIACGRGPGSFTGVRIAIAVSQGVAFAANLPVIPVSTLAALAQGQFRRGGQRLLLTALDARMDEVYWGCFTIDPRGLAVPVCPERVCSPDQVSAPSAASWFGVGSGWAAHQTRLLARCGDGVQSISTDGLCEAQDIAVLAVSQRLSGGQRRRRRLRARSRR